MKTRTIVVLVLAVILMIIVMGTAAALHFSSDGPKVKWNIQPLKTASGTQAESMKVIDLTGDKKEDIMVQGINQIFVFDENLNTIFEKAYLDMTSTMGDFDGDGVDDLVVVYDESGEKAIIAEAFSLVGDGKTLWRIGLSGFEKPSRATSVDFDGDKIREVVIGDMNGNLLCLNSDGSFRWSYTLPSPLKPDTAYVRGLDDIAMPSGTQIVAANYDGNMALLNSAGQPVWSDRFPSLIRRVRSYDLNGDGSSEIIVGGEYGRLECLEGATGKLLWGTDLGQRVSEIRSGNLDDDPATTEILVGLKEAGVVYGFDFKGQEVTRNAMSGKVTEFLALDIDEDGKQEFLAGSEEGSLRLFKVNQPSLFSMSLPGLTRLDAGKFARDLQFVAAWGGTVGIMQIDKEFAPVWYNTLVAGFIACLIIAILAFVVASIKPKPKLQYSADDMSIEGLRAKRKMLLESIADLKRSFESGEVPSAAFEARVRELREQVAAAEAELLRLGAQYQPSVMKCPNCGGSIELGEDRCPYCGTTIV